VRRHDTETDTANAAAKTRVAIARRLVNELFLRLRSTKTRIPAREGRRKFWAKKECEVTTEA
jgi:hypothetical protein